MEIIWSAGRTRDVNGLGRIGKQQLVHGKDTGETRVQSLGKECECWRLSNDPWADCNQDCFEADSGYKSGKTLDWNKLNGEGRKVELLLSVPALRIYQFATLHANRTSMWELVSPEQWTEVKGSREVRQCKSKEKLEGGRVAQIQYHGDGKRMMPGEAQRICDPEATLPGAGADVYPSTCISHCNSQTNPD